MFLSVEFHSSHWMLQINSLVTQHKLPRIEQTYTTLSIDKHLNFAIWMIIESLWLQIIYTKDNFNYN